MENLQKNKKYFASTHNLEFEMCGWPYGVPANVASYWAFRVGTCRGLYTATKLEYQIIAIENDRPGNGHLQDMFDWFENSCRRDARNLRICACWNLKFKRHLLKKRGFVQAADEADDVIKKIL
jgi:hypothetical protein